MASLVLDPYVLAAPSLAEGPEALRRYVASVVAWSELSGEPWVAVLKSGDVESALFDAGCYPATHAVTALCAQFGLDEVTPEDVGNALSRLLQSAGVCEDLCGVSDVLIDPLVLAPDVPAVRVAGAVGEGRHAPAVREATRRLVGLHALLTRCAPVYVRDHELASHDRFCAGMGVVVEGTAVIIDRGAGCVLPQLPDPFVLPSTRVLMREGRDDALRALDPVNLWMPGDSAEALRAAIRVEVLRQDLAVAWNDTDRFSIGRKFVASLPPSNFDRQPARIRKALLSCAETLLGRNDRATHALREGGGGNAPQRLRGVDKAWRRDIDHEFHLYYWELPGRRYEFSAVVSHNDYYIPS